MADGLLVVTALRSEYAALSGQVPGARLDAVRDGSEPGARSWLPELVQAGPAPSSWPAWPAALDPSLRPGDVIVANEVRDAHGRAVLRAGGPLAADLRRMGLRVRVGPIVSTDHLVNSVRERDRLAATGALAVDMESAAIARAATKQLSGTPIAVVRVIVDTVANPVNRLATVPAGHQGAAGPAAHRAGTASGGPISPGRVGSCWPRRGRSAPASSGPSTSSSWRCSATRARCTCAARSCTTQHVVADLERQGAVFVDELDDVPDDTTVVFSAHGVAPAVRDEAARRELNVIDATCPLVGKVHAEARRFAGRGDTVLLVGHAGHDETEGTLGEVPGQIHLVENAGEAERIAVADPEQGRRPVADHARSRRGCNRPSTCCASGSR